MNRKTTLAVFAVATCVALTACAQAKKSTGSKNRGTPSSKNNHAVAQPILIQATHQTTLPGRPETEPTTDYRFVIVWKSNDSPTSFFWRGEQSWEPCNVNKVVNYSKLVVEENHNGIPKPLNYKTVNTGNLDFRMGDTLELHPISGGKHPIPAEISTDKNNIIYYKTTKSKWLALPVDSITKLPSIAMP